MISANSVLIASKIDPQKCSKFLESIFEFEEKNTRKPSLQEIVGWLKDIEKDGELIKNFSEDLLFNFKDICSPFIKQEKFKEDICLLLEIIDDETEGSIPGSYLSFHFRKYLFNEIENHINIKQKSLQKIQNQVIFGKSQFKESVKIVIEKSLSKKQNVKEKFIPKSRLGEERTSTPLCDIYFEIQINDLNLLKDHNNNEENIENYWTHLFGKVAEESVKFTFLFKSKFFHIFFEIKKNRNSMKEENN